MSAGPLAQDYVVIKESPPDPRVIVSGPGLVKCPSGRLLATISILPRHGAPHPNEVHNMGSEDGGGTWHALADPLSLYTATPWAHGGAVYLFAHTPGKQYRNDDLLLLRSDDEGGTWSEPVTLFEGHFWNCPTGIVEANGYVCRAMDKMDVSGRAEVVIAGDLSKDLMDPASWRISSAVPYPGTPQPLIRDVHPPGQRKGARGDLWLEPNVVNVSGRLMTLSRVEMDCRDTTNICGICELTDDGTGLELEFVQFHPLPGAGCKFHILHDDVSRLFWMTTNLVTDSHDSQGWNGTLRARGFMGDPGNERRFLMLMYSIDALNWFQAGCLATSRNPIQSFHYVAPLIDGADLVVASRTSINAPNQHDSDIATFHRLKDFRSLALDLYPEL